MSWKDNSSDELGFEVQTWRGRSWERVRTVPPDRESVVVGNATSWLTATEVRILAYNERGFSANNPRVLGQPVVEHLTATAGEAEVCLGWSFWPREWATWAQARWKATADLPFDDAVDTWTDMPASAKEYTVTGLANGTEYTFEVRAVVVSGPGPAWTATATPLVPQEASFRLDIPCGEELCRTLTGTPVSFVDTSSGNVTQRNWSFGDGAESEVRSPTHIWSSPGFYTVTLTVSDGLRSASATWAVLVEASAPAGSCRADAETLCLHDSRFEVRMDWWSAAGESDAGRVVHAGTNESGLFRFFNPQNWEVLIKVLDGCAINQRIWVLGASTTDLGYRILVTDTVTGESRSYENEPGRPAPAIVDTNAFFAPCGTAAAGATTVETIGSGAFSRHAAGEEVSAPAVVAAEQFIGWCEDATWWLCLRNRRFGVTVTFSTPDGELHRGRVARVGTDETGVFYVFDPENWEVLVKVLDGCAINGHYWVFAASATDLRFDLRLQSQGADSPIWNMGYITLPAGRRRRSWIRKPFPAPARRCIERRFPWWFTDYEVRDAMMTSRTGGPLGRPGRSGSAVQRTPGIVPAAIREAGRDARWAFFVSATGSLPAPCQDTLQFRFSHSRGSSSSRPVPALPLLQRTPPTWRSSARSSSMARVGSRSPTRSS